MLRVITGNWWAPAVSGVLAILSGMVAVICPDKTFAALVLLFGVYAFVRGSIWLAFGLLAATAGERWWPFAMNGVVGVSIGALTFAEPQVMTLSLVSVLGAWTFLNGILEVVAADRFRRAVPNEFLLALSGVLSVVFGVAVVASRESPRRPSPLFLGHSPSSSVLRNAHSGCDCQAFARKCLSYTSRLGPLPHDPLQRNRHRGRRVACADGQCPDLRCDFDEFRQAQAHWLEDYALFRALKFKYNSLSYHDWPADLFSEFRSRWLAMWSSGAGLVIAPRQDVLNLGSEGRMNVPGRSEGNWQWRCTDELLPAAVGEQLRDLTCATNRAPTRGPG